MRTIILNLCLIFSTSAFSQQWQDVGGGVNGIVDVLKTDTVTGRLYAGGEFTQAGGLPADKIAYWDGTNWNPVGTNSIFHGIWVHVSAIAFLNGDLYIGGKFDSIGNLPVHNIARWDGTNWNALGSGFQVVGSNINALEVYNGELYAGGNFDFSGNDTIRNIAKWNGQSWEKLIHGVDDYVTTMTVFDNKLIVGGTFAGPAINDSVHIPSPSIAAWDGITWNNFSDQYSDLPRQLIIHEDTLYATGSSSVKFYDGLEWQDMAQPTGGTNPWIVGAASFLGDLYVCGFFQNPPDIAKFNGIGYDSVGNVTGFTTSLEVYMGELYAAGGFSSVSGIPCQNIARYNPFNSVDIYSKSQVSLYPNPASEYLFFDFPGNMNTEILQIKILTQTGVPVYDNSIIPANHEIYVRAYPPGLYYLIISSHETKQFITPFIVR